MVQSLVSLWGGRGEGGNASLWAPRHSHLWVCVVGAIKEGGATTAQPYGCLNCDWSGGRAPYQRPCFGALLGHSSSRGHRPYTRACACVCAGTGAGVYDDAVEVLFDAEFVGGGTLNGRVTGECRGNPFACPRRVPWATPACRKEGSPRLLVERKEVHACL